MKKSNIFLLSAFCLAFIWIILIGWFAASAINNYRKGKDPYFARSYSQILQSRKKTFPAPTSELLISGDGTTVLTILPGKELSVLCRPRLCRCSYINFKNGRSMISLIKLQDYDEPVTITLPEIPSLSLTNFSSVYINGLIQKGINLQCNRVSFFSSGNCKIGSLRLDFSGKNDQQSIFIEKSNQIDTFIASVKGFGNIRLETAGNRKNQISLSESIKLEATMDLMKKLAIGPESRVLNK